MKSSLLRRPAAVVVVASLIASAGWSAETAGAASKAPASSSKSSTPARTGKGLLPDPTLLDGSTMPAEKKSEQGMIGDFELPGDDNVKSGKVGGPQQPGGRGGGGQNQQPPGVQVDLPIPGIPIPLGGAQSAAGGQQGGGGIPPLGGQQGGAGAGGQQPMGLPQLPQPGAIGGQAGGAQSGDPSSASQGGAGDPNAKADGIQVAQLGGEGSSQDSIVGGKPPPVAIGDSAMKINTAGIAAAGAVGGQQIGTGTQQVEKNTGSGGKGTGGASGGANRSEKGRTMPAGL